MKEDSYKLCYVEDNFAWFTNDLKHQWGDDWDDAPYEHNAGWPYDSYVNEQGERINLSLIKIAFEANLDSPKSYHQNSPYSVEMINRKVAAWLSSPRWTGEDIVILAGTSLKDFKELIKKSGGTIYVEEK